MGLLDTQGAPQGAPQSAPQGGPPMDAPPVQDQSSKYLDDAEPNVTPEEQAEYDQFMENALQLIYNDGEEGGEVRPEVLKALKIGGKPKKGAATTAPAKAAPEPPRDPNAPSPDPAVQAAPPVEAAPTAKPAEGDIPADDNKREAILTLANATVAIVTQLDDSARQAGKPVSDDVLQHGSLDVLRELGEIADTAQFYDYSEKDIMGAYAQAVDMYRPKLIADGRTDEGTLKEQFNQLNGADAAGKLGEVLPGVDQGPEQ